MLVVGRDASALRSLWSIGEAQSWHLEVADTGWDALERLQSGYSPDLLVLNLPRSNGDSLHTLRSLKRLRPELSIILLSHSRDPKSKVEAIRLGAQEFLVRPLEQKRLETVMSRYLNSRNRELEADNDLEQISDNLFFVAGSPVMRKLRAQLKVVAQLDIPVLIVGESGSGKESAARLIHRLSARSQLKFVQVSCAAVPSELLEGELFGHENGPFGSTTHTKRGKLDMAEKGTILLNEITEMSSGLQAKILHLIEDKQFCRLGGGTTINADVRVLAATNLDIEQALKDKKLREDLYYMLGACILRVPPLRERREEIPLLMQQFMHRLATHYDLPAQTFSPAVLQVCQAHSWPGNLRELEHFVKRYLVIGDQEFALSELNRDNCNPQSCKEPIKGADPDAPQSDAGLKSLLHTVKGETEKNAIAAALDQTRWNRKAAARLLKVSYRTLLYKIEQHHMSPPHLETSTNGIKGNNHTY